MPNANEIDDERLAEAIEAYKLGMETPSPTAVLAVLMDAKRRKSPGDPFNKSIDQLVEHIFKNPDALHSTDPADYLKNYLRIVSEHVKTMVAEKLDKPSLDDPETLSIEIEDDWQITAFVEEQPPYSIYVSTNLFMFCARVSELLIAGLGLNIVDDDAPDSQYKTQSPFSKDEVARDIRKVLESFSADQTIAKTDVQLNAAHYIFHQIVFHNIMALIICHEFGHVLINVSRNAGEPVPFSDRAHDELEGNVENLIHAGRHDPQDCAGLRQLGPAGLGKVVASWEKEITADYIGISLAAEYTKKRGPWKEGPGVLGIAYLGFHLCFVALHMLYAYLNRQRPDFLLVSKTHPPIDFRMHCLLGWMYTRPAEADRPAVPYGEHDSYKAITQYSQEIMEKVFA